jgi:6-phospho-beta-glucosidase
MARKQGTKVVVMGGGSSYTPEIVEGLIGRAGELSLRDVWLVDIPAGEEKLSIVGALAKRMVKKANSPFKVHLTVDRREALPDADFVVTQIRVGGIAARIKDERVPLKHGVMGQETVGPGGFAKALRTVPQILAICRDMAELCPSAWLINFTNPSGIVTEAVSRHTGVNVIGLCNIPINTERSLQRQYKAKPEEMYIQFVGLNHLVWLNRVTCRGVDVTAELVAKTEAGGHWPKGLVEAIGAIPCGYHNYYYSPDKATEHLLEAQREGKPTRGEQIVEIERELFAQYRKRSLAVKPEALSKRGGALYSEAAVRLISSIHNDRRDIQCVDTRNLGALSDLPADSVVEVNCVIDRQGPHPIAVGPLPPQLRGLLQQVKAYEELTVEAAITGDRNTALAALIANPIVPNAHIAKPLLEDLLEAHRDYLPAFFPRRGKRAL